MKVAVSKKLNGTRMPISEHVHDEFGSTFLMLTRKLGQNQRLAVRYDTFEFERPGVKPQPLSWRCPTRRP